MPSLAEVARDAGLIRWDLGFDVAIMALAAGLLVAVAAWRSQTTAEDRILRVFHPAGCRLGRDCV